MRIHKIELDYSLYQTVKLPEGAAPLTAAEDGPDKIGLFYIGPDTLLGVQLGEFGAFVVPTGVSFPEDLSPLPVVHPLVGSVEPPNSRYLATVNHHHVFLGVPRPGLDVPALT